MKLKVIERERYMPSSNELFFDSLDEFKEKYDLSPELSFFREEDLPAVGETVELDYDPYVHLTISAY